jgi:hypothetical protein
MPIIGTIAGASARGFGGLRTFVPPGPPPANTPMGYVVDTSPNNPIKKFPFSTETYSNISQIASYGDNSNADNSPYNNYKFGTGTTLTPNGNGNGIIRFSFFAETSSVLASTITYSVFSAGGATNNGVAAYIVGGMLISGAGGISTCNKMLYSSETPTALGTTLSPARGGMGGVYNANTAAYFGGGTSDNGPTLFSTISKMTFSNDTLSNLGATLNQGLGFNPTSQGTYANTAGFWFGGYNQSPDSATINRLTFSSETRDNPASLAAPSRANSVMTHNTTAGYFNAGTGGVNNTQKLVYSTTTRSTLGVDEGYFISQAMSNQGA